MRLDKFIANNSLWSRSDVKRLVRNQAVSINGALATGADQKISVFSDHIAVNDQTVQAIGKQYFMLHKPANVVCAAEHTNYPTVLELLDELAPELILELQIVGRLDVDTTGLVLLTNDGQWNHQVSSPRSACMKIYEIELAENFDRKFQKDLEQGVMLEGENKATLPAELEIIDDRHLRLGIREGRYHQVKRMLAFANNKVIRLHRSRIGPLALDPALAPGEYRALSPVEVQELASAR